MIPSKKIQTINQYATILSSSKMRFSQNYKYSMNLQQNSVFLCLFGKRESKQKNIYRYHQN